VGLLWPFPKTKGSDCNHSAACSLRTVVGIPAIGCVGMKVQREIVLADDDDENVDKHPTIDQSYP
jgi:hypothetical protein